MITALFLVTGLAALGTFMWRSLSVTSSATMTEWDSAQALYAAESGVQWSAWRHWRGQSPTGNNLSAEPGLSWFDSTATSVNVGGRTLVTISAVGKAGKSAAAPNAERRLQVRYFD